MRRYPSHHRPGSADDPGVRPCPACGDLSSSDAGAAQGFPLCRCTRCRTLFTAALPEAGRAQDYYYDRYLTGGASNVPAFVDARLDEVVAARAADRRTGRWLDVGFGAASLLQAAKRAGWEAVGTEIAVSAVAAARDQGLTVWLGEVERLDLQPGFDVVSAVELLEHVPDPMALLRRCAYLLRPGGALYATTPHVDGISGRVLGTSWSIVSPPEHLQLYSCAGLQAALEGAGLIVERMDAHGAHPYELVMAARQRTRRPTVVSGRRAETSYAVNAALSRHAGGTTIRAALNGALSAVGLGDGLKVVARRPEN